MSTVIRPKQDYPTNAPRVGSPGLFDWALRVARSTIGGKYVVAATAIGLIAFLYGHMVGNLLIFAGQDAINAYAKKLKDLGPLLWVARLGLLAIFVLHVTMAIRLKARSAAARPSGYYYQTSVQTTWAAKYMMITGSVVGLFLLYHLAHYTFGWVKPAEVETPDGVKAVHYLDLTDSAGRHDVYSMVVYGFRNPVVSGIYLAAQLTLFFHLIHGVQSVFQTLSLNSPRYQRLIRGVGALVALGLLVGNCAIVVAVLGGWVEPNVDVAKTFAKLSSGA